MYFHGIIPDNVDPFHGRLFQIFPAFGCGGDQSNRRFRDLEGQDLYGNITPGDPGAERSKKRWFLAGQSKDDHDYPDARWDTIESEGEYTHVQDL